MKKLSEDLNDNKINHNSIKKLSLDYTNIYNSIPTFKILFIGNPNSGKTSIIERYINNSYIYNYNTTICVDFRKKIINIKDLLNYKNISLDDKLSLLDYYDNNDIIKLQLWDTSGSSKYINLIKSYFKTTNMFVLVFDISDDNYNQIIIDYLKEIDDIIDDPELFIVINKTDLKNKKLDIDKIITDYKIIKYNFIEISCLYNININELFFQISLILIKKELSKNKYNTDISNNKKITKSNICGINSRSYCY